MWASGRTWITPILRTVRQWKPNTFLMHLPWLMTAARHHKFWWMEASAHRPKSTVTTAETSFSDADGRTHSGLAYTITVTDPVFGAPDCTVHFRKPKAEN